MSLRWSAVSLMVLALVACQPAAEPGETGREPGKTAGARGGQTAEVERGVEQVRQQWQEAYNAGEVDRVVGLYADDATMFPPLQEPQEGSDAIRSFLEGEVAQGQPNVTIRSAETVVAGETAIDAGSFTNRMTPAAGGRSGGQTAPQAGGQATEVSGHYIVVLQRQQDGSWKITQHIWNFRNPPPASPQQQQRR